MTIERSIACVMSIRPGDRVTILVPAESDRRGAPNWREKTGTAVRPDPAGWVLNFGGGRGAAGVATPENLVRIRRSAQCGSSPSS